MKGEDFWFILGSVPGIHSKMSSLLTVAALAFLLKKDTRAASNWNLKVRAGIKSHIGACLKLHLRIKYIIFTHLRYYRGMARKRLELVEVIREGKSLLPFLLTIL